jgi:Na+/H+ antiporter NhaD/arsenite permease-like protein
MDDLFTLEAALSLAALALVLVLSWVREALNPGLVSIAFALVLAASALDLSAGDVLRLFPGDLFAMLLGITLFIAIAQVNGTMEKLTAHLVRLVGRRRLLLPLALFLLVTLVSTLGPGNIGATVLLAPAALAIGARVGLSGFLVTLLVIGAANGAGLSPLAPTGVISTGLVSKMAGPLGIADPGELAWRVHGNAELTIGLLHIAGFLVFGGLAWLRRQRREAFDVERVAPRPAPFDRRQRWTLAALALFVLLVVLPALPGARDVLPDPLRRVTANVGSVALLLTAALALVGSADVPAALRAVPWSVLLMVCGVTVLVETMERTGGTRLLVSLLGSISTPETLPFWLGLTAGLVSAYSSSSGVVIPMFLPLVPGLIGEHGGGDPASLVSSINIGAHLVDTSPFSTLGAICLSFAATGEHRARLYRQLLAWGLSMAVVGGLVCWALF